ncbi:sugar kinase (plasmid) [Deinococcus metallilatus]|uniref:Sugar kinase n=1 Tax=Deinococcus metallilatus TaxID=1211322 RepID=A0AAJ5F7F0_9DEIO|nr:FGGY-family carbohydrate kinase [Deinococcus metallilatus]MBB5293448.1 xylulokinase [Deinococcus metallilatus]QBY06535.1 sugar kinase [Deinococcus metallilatus]RXJ17878.1 sugar kinase [Deinococcus metallilatus]TLK32150.1 sugar kinase [Deinococcus metallilatus]GMA15332.1 sugar kinase [Deinococcus metallilatus]
MSQLLLGIDIGTGSSKGVLVRPDGTIVRSHSVPHDISVPRPGFVEQDADTVWWVDVVTLCRALLSGEYSGADVAGVAISAIGPCLLPLDEEGRPLRPGILYGVDTRGTPEIPALEAEFGAENILAHSGMALTSQAIGPKVRWLQRHEPQVWARTRMLATASSYVTYRLTGRHVMDRHTASHYMPMYDPATGDWNADYSERMGVAGRLPELGWSDERAGEVTPGAAALTGLRPGTPVAVGAVDALSEAISVGAVQPGDLMIMYGSTTFFILVQEQPTPDPRVWTVAGAFAGQFNLAAGMSTTGSLTKWFAEELARELPGGEAYAELFAAAGRVPPGARGLVVLPYFSGERTPINDPQAKGVLAGLTLAHTRGDLFRATLEGVACGIRHNLETFAALGTPIRRAVAVGGGTQGNLWPQIVSDVAGTPQVLPRVTIGASYGDAFLAGLVAGQVRREDLDAWVGQTETIEPDPDVKPTYDHLYALYRELYENTKDVVHRLHPG